MRWPLLLALVLLQLVVARSPSNAAEDDADRLTRLAVRAQLDGKHDQALDLYSEALNDTNLLAHRRANLHTDRGVIYARLGRNKLALVDFNEAIKLFPENPSVYNNRGSTLLAAGHDREAVKDFNRAILLAPGYAAAYLNRGTAYLALQEPEAALVDYNRAVRLEPTNEVVLSARGVVHLKAGRPNAATRDFSQAIAANNKFEAAYSQRAQARMQLKEYEAAVEDYSRAIVYAPVDAKLHVQRGTAYLYADDAEAALRDYSKAIELKEAFPEAHSARALANIMLTEHETALSDLSRALELDQRSAESYAYRALVYRHMEQLSLAERDLATAKRLNSSLASVRWIEGELAEAQGRTQQAISFHRAALAVDPTHKFASAALERLKAPPPFVTEEVLENLKHGSWQILRRAKRYFAINEAMPGLEVPLEQFDGAPPKILDWQVRPPPHKRYGVLRFTAGTIKSGGTLIPLESAAVVDVTTRRVLSVVPHLEGTRKAEWTWSEARIDITSSDGVRDVIVLDVRRTAPAVAHAGRPRSQQRPPSGAGMPDWAPWNENAAAERPRRRQAARQQRQKPKTLFDVLFGN